jgi:N-acetylglutamate synthase-like GNAT family acetyltransferase
MKIRKATIRDKNNIKKLIGLYPGALIQNYIPDTKYFFVAEDFGKIVGCCALEVYSKRMAEIRSLAVAKNYQGRGLATQMIERCMTLARQKRIYEVLAITHRAKLFNRFGFNTFHKEKLALLKIL